MEKKQIVFIEYIRVVACFLVMLVHASENFYGADSSGLAGNVSMLANESNRFWVSFYDGALSRICVPLFMVVSAFLLVPMKEGMTMHSFYKRRFMRILPPFIIFQLLYTFIPALLGQWTWNEALDGLWMLPFNFSPMAGHLWFMYPLISLYLIIPVVSPWLENQRPKRSSHSSAFSFSQPSFHGFTDLSPVSFGANVSGMGLQCSGTVQATWAIWCWHITSESTSPGIGARE